MYTEVEIKRTTLLKCLGTCDVNFQIIYATSNGLNVYYCPFCGENIDIAYLEMDVKTDEYEKMLEGQKEKIRLLKGSVTKQNTLAKRIAKQQEKIRQLEGSLTKQDLLESTVERQQEKIIQLEDSLTKQSKFRITSDNSPPLSGKNNNDEETNKKEQVQTQKKSTEMELVNFIEDKKKELQQKYNFVEFERVESVVLNKSNVTISASFKQTPLSQKGKEVKLSKMVAISPTPSTPNGSVVVFSVKYPHQKHTTTQEYYFFWVK